MYTLYPEGDSDHYRAFLRRMEALPEWTKVNTLMNGVQRIRREQSVFSLFFDALKGFLHEHPQERKDLRVWLWSEYSLTQLHLLCATWWFFFLPLRKVFGREALTFIHIIFTENSPIQPVFDLGVRQLSETGVVAAIRRKWTGDDLKSEEMFLEQKVVHSKQVNHPKQG